MPKVVVLSCLLATLGLASCYSPLYHGREKYSEGMRRLRYDPESADRHFAAADRDLAEAIVEDDLDVQEQVVAVTLRARSLIELERYTEVPAVIATPIQGYRIDQAYRGDSVGLALIRASKLDPERAYAELLLAEKKAATLRSRTHLAWEEVHLLLKLRTPQAKAEAARICDAYAGKIDFDAMKKSNQ